MVGTLPLGVTGVVAAEVPVEALKPLPASKCTHSIPLTGSSLPALPVVVLPKEKPPTPAVPVPGLSILYFKNSVNQCFSILQKIFLR